LIYNLIKTPPIFTRRKLCSPGRPIGIEATVYQVMQRLCIFDRHGALKIAELL